MSACGGLGAASTTAARVMARIAKRMVVYMCGAGRRVLDPLAGLGEPSMSLIPPPSLRSGPRRPAFSLAAIRLEYFVCHCAWNARY
jgi:hypothetical protein